MPLKDPEKRREYQREYTRKRRASGVYAERERELRKLWLENHPGYQRQRYLGNRDAVIKRSRQWELEHPDQLRKTTREYERKLRQLSPERQSTQARRFTMLKRHGMRPEDWATMWAAQGGRCYLGDEKMQPDEAHVDHDHRCCPKDVTCARCRRGLAHRECNWLIGLAADDPGKLHTIARNLEIVLPIVTERLAGKPEQLQLDLPA